MYIRIQITCYVHARNNALSVENLLVLELSISFFNQSVLKKSDWAQTNLCPPPLSKREGASVTPLCPTAVVMYRIIDIKVN